MVRPTLSGDKTQTRRIVKPQPNTQRAYADRNSENVRAGPDAGAGRWRWLLEDGRWQAPHMFACPFGGAGDRLWVRENAWIAPPGFGDEPEDAPLDDDGRKRVVGYSASMDSEAVRCARDYGVKQTPSIHMPRWASRITLEVTGVRVERLQDISEADALAEGMACLSKDGGRTYKYGIPDRDGLPGNNDDGWHWREWEQDPRDAFRKLWDSLADEKTKWAANPWVWVIAFKRVTP